MSYVILHNRPWCEKLSDNLSKNNEMDFIAISNKEDFNIVNLDKIKPDYIFVPHWSHIIPSEIYNSYNCIIFHMTDLPYGQGGSPLQNLIIRGHEHTKISALKCEEEIDSGPIYLKKKLSLDGNAEKIFIDANNIIEKMIIEIIKKKIKPKPQKGKKVKFSRRLPSEGNWSNEKSISKVYDYIRMLDAEGYPPAFVYVGDFKLEFTKASRKVESIISEVKITRKKENE